MRTITTWYTREEPYAYQRDAGRYHPARRLIIKRPGVRVIVPLGAGTADDLAVFEEDGRLYIVTTNGRLGYAGLESVSADPTTAEDRTEAFLQADHEVADILGPRGLDLHPRTIARRLGEYLS